MIEIIVHFSDGSTEIWYVLPNRNKDWMDANVEAIRTVVPKLHRRDFEFLSARQV
jgi:hypothetical protein